ncbi:hypothetical protein I7I53_08732 [Histoplasma capsulatum var. duboisii H88]|uniref:Uncharacterized protein n=1 Tax=Ajellomyces capsulatus (strain H88) TaxID=544711 RepID=A0A8A1LA88_AJEC8|nr:hypothetical protein I7I53_08732 [Histoplasma capsulatum var. duboisii H88]
MLQQVESSVASKGLSRKLTLSKNAMLRVPANPSPLDWTECAVCTPNKQRVAAIVVVYACHI